ncbi:MAG TPA: S49 family peptidase, partial [Burkholderiaceae bacterium]|nr:S49 family peptidase [Burkholderiaceae bacterium]
MIAGALRLLYNVLVFPWLWLAWRIRSAAAFRRPRALKLRLAQLPIIGGQARSMPFSRRRTIEDLSARLDALARHPRVTGLHVELDATPASLVDGAELRALLDAVRQSGKRVHVHVQQPETRNLAAAAAADRLSTSPGSMVMVGGIGLEIPFAGELLERHGVRVQSVQRREYKGAAEPLARSGPSEPLRESLQALVDALFEALAQTLARPGWQAQRARDLLDRGPLTLQQALDSGLLDAAEHAEEAEQALAGVQSDEAGGESPAPEAPPAPQRRVPDKGARPLPATRRLLPLEAAALLAPRPLALKPEPVIAFVAISGAIVDRPVSGPRQRFAVASELAPRIRALADSARVQAIVLALDTRGGTVTGSDRIWSAARYALGRKPVLAWMRNYAAERITRRAP